VTKEIDLPITDHDNIEKEVEEAQINVRKFKI
jgi:hypothetical protein